MTLTELYNKNYLDILNKGVEDILDDILYEHTNTVKLSILDPKLDKFALHVPQRILPVSDSGLLISRYLSISFGPEQPFRIVLLRFYDGIEHYNGEVVYQQPKQDMMNKKERLEYVKEQFFKLFKKKHQDILFHL